MDSIENLSKNLIRFQYKNQNEELIQFTVSSMKNIDSLLEDFRRFLIAIGFSSKNVENILTCNEVEEKFCFIKQDIKQALEYLEEEKYQEALSKIQEAYDE